MKTIEIKNRKRHLIETIIFSIIKLYTKDGNLVKKGLCERCLTHRLAVYLEKIFESEGFSVDCEFNKSFYGDVVSNKVLSSLNGNYVDIIIHKRSNKQGENLLCAEVKKEENYKDRNKDRKNLKILTEENRFNYAYGFYIILGKVLERTQIEVYGKGRYVTKLKLT